MDTKKVKLYKFYADWCAPCKQQTAIFGREEPLNVELISVDVEENEELAKKFGVRNLPTLILVDDEDNIIISWHGITRPKVINDFINEH